jgi:hypothetical protein
MTPLERAARALRGANRRPLTTDHPSMQNPYPEPGWEYFIPSVLDEIRRCGKGHRTQPNVADDADLHALMKAGLVKGTPIEEGWTDWMLTEDGRTIAAGLSDGS